MFDDVFLNICFAMNVLFNISRVWVMSVHKIENFWIEILINLSYSLELKRGFVYINNK